MLNVCNCEYEFAQFRVQLEFMCLRSLERLNDLVDIDHKTFSFSLNHHKARAVIHVVCSTSKLFGMGHPKEFFEKSVIFE